MVIRLPGIARRIRTYFVQLQRNVMPLKKVIDQLKQSYPETMTDCNQMFLIIYYIKYLVNCYLFLF